MINDHYKELLRKHLNAENSHLLDETLSTLSDDCIFDDKALGKVFCGHDEIGFYYQEWWNGFSMTVHTEERYYPDPELVIVETRFKGKHTGSFFGIEATNNDIDLPLAIFITLKDGLMSGERFYWDKATLAQQLALPNLHLKLPEAYY